jgi:hypothetical protein
MNITSEARREAAAHITEARFKIKEALASADLASVEWWQKELKTRLNWKKHVDQWLEDDV